MSPTAVMLLIDIAAISLLTLVIYFPRHHRADLVVAFTGVNIGVLGVAAMLSSVEVSMGFGLGLFGVLSIIRLRSSEISQREIAYFFAALAIGLLCGLPSDINYVAIGAVIALVVALAVTDSQRLFGHYFTEDITLDRAIADQEELRLELAGLLDAEILGVTTTRLDLVNDTTWVQVRGRRAPQPGDAADRPTPHALDKESQHA